MGWGMKKNGESYWSPLQQIVSGKANFKEKLKSAALIVKTGDQVTPNRIVYEQKYENI